MGALNLVWFLIFGWLNSIIYLVFSVIFALTIIGIPIAKSLLQFAKLSAFPFGKEVIKETELKGKENVSGFRKTGGIILNIIWFPVGLILSLLHLILGILAFITILGIPIGVVYVRMGKFLLFPIGAKVVSKKQAMASAVANEISKRQN